jgi:hypothetical protein
VCTINPMREFKRKVGVELTIRVLLIMLKLNRRLEWHFTEA